jgi:acetyl-CoA carboxylase biotin carboxyl carrier protein
MAGPVKNGGGTEGMRIDPALVRELAELLTENGLTEIEVEDGDRKVRVQRSLQGGGGGAGGNLSPAQIAAFMMHREGDPSAPSPQPMMAPPMHAEAAVGDAGGEAVKSPMVGTAFLAAEPGGPPFVSPGDSVKEGDTLLIVEAMKVMNPITSPRSGTVKQVLVENGQPVEFDQPLVLLA